MRVLHCCLAAFYIDGFGYQENILPRLHREMGHDVRIVASTESYLNNSERGFVKSGHYYTEDGIAVTRLPYVSLLPLSISRRLRAYRGLERVLSDFRPDIIFLHDCQFFDLRVIKKYLLRNSSVRLFVDCHTDYVNSARGFVSKYLLHHSLYRRWVRSIAPHVVKFFPTLPCRASFLREAYGVQDDQMELLCLGVDDARLNGVSRDEVRRDTRARLGLKDDDFLLVTGGKLDSRKRVDFLLDELRMLRERPLGSSVRLLIFGDVAPGQESLLERLDREEGVIYVGWQDWRDAYKFWLSADLAVFVGTHSVFWEEVVGLGVPAIFKRWEGIEHVDIGGNCAFLEGYESGALVDVIGNLLDDQRALKAMQEAALGLRRTMFFYSQIARRALGIPVDADAPTLV